MFTRILDYFTFLGMSYRDLLIYIDQQKNLDPSSARRIRIISLNGILLDIKYNYDSERLNLVVKNNCVDAISGYY